MRRAHILRLALMACAGGGCDGPPAHLVEVDAAPDASLFSCDPLAQSCPEGDGCFWVGPGAFHCLPAAGEPRYHVCASSSECSPGDGCHLDDLTDFYCTGYCDYRQYAGVRDPGRCTANELCAAFDGAVGICLGVCDVLAPDCPSGQGCYYIHLAADLCLPETGVDGAPGESCGRSNDCRPGSGCVGPFGTGTCAVYCNYQLYPDQHDPRCAADESCREIDPGEQVGACGA